MKNLGFRTSVLVSSLLIVCCALAWGSLARAEDGKSECSNEILKGDYGFKVDGQILAGPRTGLLRALAMTHFDGQGNLSQVDFATLNGIPTGSDWRPGTGTYSVDPDCTGQAQINFRDGSPSLHLRLVVVRGGKEVHTIVEGNATGSLGIKVDAPDNSREK